MSDSMPLIGVVLAAGKGTRFGQAPKCIQPVCGLPLARHTVEAFKAAACGGIICLVHERQAEIMAALGDDIVYIRSANPIESAFATVRLRQRVTKGAGSRAKALWMVYKLLDMASLRWRRVNSPELVAQVLLGEKFVDGLPVSNNVGNAA